MPDIVIAGATFRGVPQIDIPKEGSGTASFIYEDGTKSITQNGTGIDVSGYAAVDVAVPSTAPVIQSLSVTQNGEYTAPSGVDGYSPVTVNVSGGGGGGGKQVVSGTFTTGETASAVEEVSVPYLGNGFPEILFVWITGTVTAIETNAIHTLIINKYNAETPTYDDDVADKNKGDTSYFYRYSGSNVRRSGMTTDSYSNSGAPITNNRNVVWKNNKTLSYITLGTSKGLNLNTDYLYYAVFSE